MTDMQRHPKYRLLLMLGGISVIGICIGSILINDAYRFREYPQIIDQLRPYLAVWVVSEPTKVEAELKQVEQELGVSIELGTWPTEGGKLIRSMLITVESWGEASHGYLYLETDSPMVPSANWELRRIEERLYLFNRYE